MARYSAVLLRIFYILYAMCFTWVLFCSVFVNARYSYDTAVSFILMISMTGILLVLYKKLKFSTSFWDNWGKWACVVAVLFTAGIQLVNGLAMRYDPAYDLWAVYGGGIAWAEQGTLAHDEYFMGYFHMFPNNMGGAFLFYCLFTVTNLLGFRDYYAAALLLNILLLQISMILCYKILSKISGKATGVLGLLCFILFPPFYMMGPVFYTDLLSVAAPIAAIYLFVRARQSNETGKKAAFYLVMGIVIAVGAVVKFTVVVVLVAAALATILAPPRSVQKNKLSQIILPIALSILAFLLIMWGWRAIQATQLDKSRLERESMPFSHWVAMGLIGDGGYDEADYDRAMKLPSKTARETTNRALIATRLSQPSAMDLAKLFTRKAIRCYGDGTYDLGIFLDDGPHQRVLAHEWVLADGKYYDIYRHASQGMYLAFFILSLIPPVQAALSPRKGCRALRAPIPWLSFFGLFVFLMMWETNSRYTLNFMPVLVVCAALGAAWLRIPPSLKKVRLPKSEKAHNKI